MNTSISNIKPHVQWLVYMINNQGETEVVPVWATSKNEAENDALFECKIKNATVFDSVLRDNIKQHIINK